MACFACVYLSVYNLFSVTEGCLYDIKGFIVKRKKSQDHKDLVPFSDDHGWDREGYLDFGQDQRGTREYMKGIDTGGLSHGFSAS